MKKGCATMLILLLLSSGISVCAEASNREVFAYYADGIAQFVENGRYGLFNLKGEMILPAEFYWISPWYSDGLARAVSDDRTVFINQSGDVVIELPAEVRAYTFHNGYTWILREIDGAYGLYLIDVNGKILTSANITDAEKIRDGLAFCVRWDGEYSLGCYVNTSGEVVFDLPFDPEHPYVYDDYSAGIWHNRDFHNGLALFWDGDAMRLIDKQGNFVRELPALPDDMDFSHGPLSVAANPETYLFGYMNMMGEYIVPPIGIEALPMIEERGLLLIELKYDVELDPVPGPVLWRCYNEMGEALFDITCDRITPFHGGYAVYSVGDAISIIDRDGNMIIADSTIIHWPERGSSYYVPMSEGMIVFEENGKLGFMDIHGETVIAPQYDNVEENFDDGYAVVRLDGKKYIINMKGEIIAPW